MNLSANRSQRLALGHALPMNASGMNDLAGEARNLLNRALRYTRARHEFETDRTLTVTLCERVFRLQGPAGLSSDLCS
jgi:hypothetical protein